MKADAVSVEHNVNLVYDTKISTHNIATLTRLPSYPTQTVLFNQA